MKKLQLIFVSVIVIFSHAQIGYSQSSKNFSNSILWKISGKNLPDDSYLLLITPTCDNKIVLPEKLLKVLNKVKAVAVEEYINSKENSSKLQKLLVPQNDTQKLKSILSETEIDNLIKKAKESGVLNKDVNEVQIKLILSQYKCLYIQSILTSVTNPCTPGEYDRIEKILSEFAKDKSKKYSELYTPEELFAEYDSYPKSYWHNNVMYLTNNTRQVKTATAIKNNLYKTENLMGLSTLFTVNDYFKLKYNTANIISHQKKLGQKITATIQAQSTLVAINIPNFIISENAIYNQLIKQGYILTPVL